MASGTNHSAPVNRSFPPASGSYSRIWGEKSQLDSRACKFKINKEILQQPIEPSQAQKILATGRSDLLDKFISKGGKPFSAYLVMDEKGKVTFDFPAREDPEKHQ